MEAANRGAKEVGGRSVGCNIELPSEQAANAYLDRCVRTHYFFVRKALLVKYSYAFVVMPGGAALKLLREIGPVDYHESRVRPDTVSK